jgi:hypothetical protein
MTIQEHLSYIVSTTASNKIIPFLKSLKPEERKVLEPEVKKLAKYYSEIVSEDNRTYRSRGNAEHWATLAPALFVCYDRKAFEKSWSAGSHILREDVIYTLLDWYQPVWFSDYINGLANRDRIGISYPFLMDLADKGYVQPSPDLIAKILPYANTVIKKAGPIFSLAPLEERPITLDEHIWYVFNYESPINSAKWTGNPAHKHLSWMEILKRYADAGRISRERLLKESLAASARNFNKILSGWFADLFTYLQPTDEELSAMQSDLIAALSAAQSKSVANALTYLKKLSKLPSFDTPAFLQYAPVLLSSSTKSVQTATLGILQKLARTDKQQRPAICEAIASAFISTDNATQTRAAELIVAYGDEKSATLAAAITAIESSLLAGPKLLLRAWLPGSAEISLPELDMPADTSILQTETKIMLPEDPEALIFLMSQAMENNAPHHFEQLLSGVLQHHTQISATHVLQMEPAFQRAFKVMADGLTGNAGLLDDLLAVFLVEYGFVLEDMYPDEAAGFRKQYDKHVPKSREKIIEWSRNKLRVALAKGWTVRNDLSGTYEVYRQLVLTAIQQLHQQQYLPLLSMPTHVGGWITPLVLVERLLNYQAAGVVPGAIDMQVAIARVAFENTADAIAAAEQLTGEYKSLMKFLLDKHAMPEGPFDSPALWMMAGLAKSPETVYDAFSTFPYSTVTRAYLTGQFEWKTIPEKYLAYGNYNQETQDYDRYDDWHIMLRIAFPVSPNVTMIDRYFSNDQLTYTAVNDHPILPEFMNGGYLQLLSNDVQRLMSLHPNNPDILLAYFISGYMHNSLLDEVTEKRGVQQMLEALNVMKPAFREMTYLFLATAMLNADSTNRSMAAEIWIDRVQTTTIDSEKIGAIIGTHQALEWAPMKRWIDLITTRMQKISAHHNRELEKMLTACLLKLPAQGIKDQRKLMELYHEVLVTNSSSIKDNVTLVDKLTGWSALSSLKKIATALIKL